jgi:lysophospholipase L1-like esterase
MMKRRFSACSAALAFSLALHAQTYRFDFGSPVAAEGFQTVTSSMIYSPDRGFGFEPGAVPMDMVRKKGTDVTKDFVTSDGLFRFSVKLPEGNYKVTITLGDTQGTSCTTVKSEVRRLMLESLSTNKGETLTATFGVNVRTPQLSKGNAIKLNSRELDYATGIVKTYTWDDKLTLQFYGSAPAVCAVEIEPATDDVVTVFIIGDSTVTDQASGGTWGQYLPRWFDSRVVVANHAESGMTIKGFRFGRRWDKIMESAQPGDYLLIQLGTNDEKKRGHDPMWDAADHAGDWVRTHSDPEKDYVWGLATMALEAKRHGMIPVIVSPMTKIDRRTATATEVMTPYGTNARRGAELGECAYIDLWGMSRSIVAALGRDALSVYADGTHTDNYGAYLFSLAIVQTIRDLGLGLSQYVLPGTPSFDANAPKPALKDFTCPIEPSRPARKAAAAGTNGQTEFGPL